MKRTLCLVLALAMTGAPTFAAEFETPLGEYKTGQPVEIVPLGGAAFAPVSTDIPVKLPERIAGIALDGVAAKPQVRGVTTYIPPSLAAKARRGAARNASAAAERKESPRAELAAALAGSREQIYDGERGSTRPDGSEVSAPDFEGSTGGERLGRSGGAHRGGGGGDWNGSRSPRGPSDESPLSRAWTWLKEVPQEWKIGVSIGVIVLATVFGFYEHSKHRNDYWLHSRSHTEIVQVDSARKTGDADKLASIAEGVHARQDRMVARIAQAKKTGAKTVDDKTHDKVSDAEHLAAFDGLVWSRARLNHNFVSNDPATRLGEQTPSTWAGREQELEQEAVSNGFEGKLALSLRDLRGEVDREETSEAALKTQIDGFEGHVPFLFGGVMKGELEKGRADLKEFQDKEVAPEEGLWTAKNAAMRGRVSDKLYKADAGFHGHRDHRDALADLFNTKVDPAYKTASGIDSDLSSMISHRNSEATWMAIAAMHTHDAETYTTTDSNGNTETHTRYVDNSGTYRALAAMEASAAASDARSANDGLARLKPMVAALYADPQIAREELRGMLPTVNGRTVGDGDFNLVADLLFHPMFGFFGSLSSASSGESARSSFAPVLNSLRQLDGEVAGRRDGEIKWVETAISTDLDAEMQQAGHGVGSW